MIPIGTRLLPVILPILMTIALLAVVVSVSVDMLSSVRAFVGAESLWAKGEKEAAYFLNRYAQSRAEADFRNFEKNIAVPLGDRKARLELGKVEPDFAVARQGFIEGRNHPDDVPGMIRLFRRFDKVSFMAKAIEIWSKADDGIGKLVSVAEQLHRRIASHEDDAVGLLHLIDQVNTISRELTPMEEEFSYTLGEAARKAEFILVLTMTFLAMALIVLAIALSYRMFARNEKVEEALRLSEERLSLAVQGSSDGLWDWNMLTGAAYYSPRLIEMVGHDPEQIKPHHDGFLEILHPDDLDTSRRAMRAHLRDHAPYEVEFRLRAKNGEYRWFLSRGQAIRNGQGRAVRMAGSIKDITDRKEADAAISRHAMQQSLIAAFGQLALKNPEADELMAQAVVVTCQGLNVELCRLLVFGSDDHVLERKAASGWNADWASRLIFDAVEETEDRFSIGVRETVIVDDFELERRFRPSSILRAHGVRSSVEMLIRGARGSYAVLGAYSREAAQFTEESANFLRGITNTLASSMDRKVVDDQLLYMAQFDGLTGLANRRLHLDRLSQTIKQAGRTRFPIGVLFVDIDRFKVVNDSLGHSAGDQVLVQVAQRLKANVRSGDMVSRHGGDEFAVTLVDLVNAENAGVVAQKILEALSLPFGVGGQEVHVSASVGISIYPIDGADADTLLRNADTAMYRAKELGRNRYQYFLAQMNERAVARLKIETQLRGALERGEFLLHYQPKVNIASGEISGYEALLRWQHPERGLVSPADFIQILEETGIIIPVGAWVVRKVCEQLKDWQAAGMRLRPVAVNLSARQFDQKNLDAIIGDIVNVTGANPRLLEFELTESMLMSDPEAAVRMLRNIKAFGCRLSVDDFGTGYSSLAYLKRFPLDSLKIDRTFIRDITNNMDDATIGIAIIKLAHSLKLSVVAEGVETEAQLDFLRMHECDEAQGYYFARPMPAADCVRALGDDSWTASSRTSN